MGNQMKIINTIKKQEKINCFIECTEIKGSWKEILSSNVNVRKFSSEIIRYYLKKHDFSNCKLDSYSLSPAYYAMTGRKGAWVYEKNDTAIVICDHPNADGKALIFPEIGKGGVMQDLIAEMPTPPNGFQLARVPSVDIRNVQEKLYSQYPMMKFVEVPEYAQDWLFPVQILDAKDVVSMKGKGYQNIRTSKNKVIKNNRIILKPFNREFTIIKLNDINDLIRRWSRHFDGTSAELESWLNPLYAIIDMIKSEEYDLSGNAIYCNGKLQAITVYEKPILNNSTANLIMSFCNSQDVSGVSDFAWVSVCSELIAEGVQKMNVGGSESYGINWYKCKFNPVESKKLSTIDVK
jgi:hypothetical protein